MKLLGGNGGLPHFAFLDSTGAMLVNSVQPARDGQKGGEIGHPYEPSEVDWFMKMLAKAAPKMSAEECGSIEKFLRAQKKQ